MFDWLSQEESGSALTYLAAQGDLLIVALVPAVALGAFAGDDVCYWLGRKVGDPIARRLFKGQKGRARLEWAEHALHRRGGLLIAVGRFIPGGRTATTFAAGTLEMPYRSFLLADALAAALWSVYICALGYLGGEAFKDSLWLPLVSSLAAAMAVGFGFEVWRRVQRRRGKDILGGGAPGADDSLRAQRFTPSSSGRRKRRR